jgi:hypothetical protein
VLAIEEEHGARHVPGALPLDEERDLREEIGQGYAPRRPLQDPTLTCLERTQSLFHRKLLDPNGTPLLSHGP